MSAPPCATTTTAAPRRLPLVVYVLGAGIVLVGTTEFVIAGLLPRIGHDLGVSIPQGGVLITAFAAGMIVGAPLMAVATLHVPQRLTLGVTLGIFAAGHVVAAATDSYGVVLAARVLTALAAGAFWAISAVVVARTAPPALRARALAILIGGLTIANVAGVPLGTWVGEAVGWRPLFWALAAVAVAAVAVVVPLVPTHTADVPRPDLRRELRAFRSVPLLLALATIVARQTGLFGTFSYVAVLLTGRAGLAVALVPIALALFGTGAFVGSQVGGRLGDARPWTVLFAGLTATMLVLLALGTLATSAAVALPLLFALGVASFSIDPILNARIIGEAGDAPTLASATTTSAFNVGNALGPLLGGLVVVVDPGAPALIGAACVAGAIVIALVTIRVTSSAGPVSSARS